MTAREFTIDELDTLIAEATPGPWRGDRNDGTVKYAILAGEHEEPIVVLSVDHKSGTHGFGCGYGDEDETRYAKDPQADERLVLAAPDLAAFARQLLTEREAVARLHRQQVERLEDDAATVAAERDALRATVDRLRPVVEAVATWIKVGAKAETREDGSWLRLVDALADELGLSEDDDYDTVIGALRALLADAPADIGEVLERGADADGAALDALGIAPAGVPDVG